MGVKGVIPFALLAVPQWYWQCLGVFGATKGCSHVKRVLCMCVCGGRGRQHSVCAVYCHGCAPLVTTGMCSVLLSFVNMLYILNYVQ